MTLRTMARRRLDDLSDPGRVVRIRLHRKFVTTCQWCHVTVLPKGVNDGEPEHGQPEGCPLHPAAASRRPSGADAGPAVFEVGETGCSS